MLSPSNLLLLMIICSVNDRESRIYENPDTDDDYEEYLSVVILNFMLQLLL